MNKEQHDQRQKHKSKDKYIGFSKQRELCKAIKKKIDATFPDLESKQPPSYEQTMQQVTAHRVRQKSLEQ